MNPNLNSVFSSSGAAETATGAAGVSAGFSAEVAVTGVSSTGWDARVSVGGVTASVVDGGDAPQPNSEIINAKTNRPSITREGKRSSDGTDGSREICQDEHEFACGSLAYFRKARAGLRIS